MASSLSRCLIARYDHQDYAQQNVLWKALSNALVKCQNDVWCSSYGKFFVEVLYRSVCASGPCSKNVSWTVLSNALVKMPNGLLVLELLLVILLVLSFGFERSITVFLRGSFSRGQYLISWLTILLIILTNSLCIRCQIIVSSAVLTHQIYESTCAAFVQVCSVTDNTCSADGHWQ